MSIILVRQKLFFLKLIDGVLFWHHHVSVVELVLNEHFTTPIKSLSRLFGLKCVVYMENSFFLRKLLLLQC